MLNYQSVYPMFDWLHPLFSLQPDPSTRDTDLTERLHRGAAAQARGFQQAASAQVVAVVLVAASPLGHHNRGSTWGQRMGYIYIYIQSLFFDFRMTNDVPFFSLAFPSSAYSRITIYIYIYICCCHSIFNPCQVTPYRGHGSMPQGTFQFTAVAMRGEKSPFD